MASAWTRRRAPRWVQAGVLWGELDSETQAFGLATTCGFVGHTGVAGLTLRGGIDELRPSGGSAIRPRAELLLWKTRSLDLRRPNHRGG
jgi:hypothetical protein